MPVTLQNMNYVSIVVVGLTVFVLVLWFSSNKGIFMEPCINMVELGQKRMAAMHDGMVIEGLDQAAVHVLADMKMKQ